jgi:hypothetical protein
LVERVRVKLATPGLLGRLSAPGAVPSRAAGPRDLLDRSNITAGGGVEGGAAQAGRAGRLMAVADHCLFQTYGICRRQGPFNMRVLNESPLQSIPTEMSWCDELGCFREGE